MEVDCPKCFVILLNIQISKTDFSYFIKCVDIIRAWIVGVRGQCVGMRRVDFCGDDLATDGSQINHPGITCCRRDSLERKSPFVISTCTPIIFHHVDTIYRYIVLSRIYRWSDKLA